MPLILPCLLISFTRSLGSEFSQGALPSELYPNILCALTVWPLELQTVHGGMGALCCVVVWLRLPHLRQRLGGTECCLSTEAMSSSISLRMVMVVDLLGSSLQSLLGAINARACITVWRVGGV
jgi:hypothetical protein